MTNITASAARRQAPAYVKKLPDPNPVYVVDFFAGCGGMSWGFANTRQSHVAYKVLAGIDIDPKAIATYRRNIPAQGIVADIESVAKDPDSLRRLIPKLTEDLRPLIFIGCPPCQGFSAHRKKDLRDDPRNNLLMAFAQLVSHFRPDVVVMENVPEILNGRFRSYFLAAANHLGTAGYKLTMDIVDMSLYGVPQRRRRAIVFGALVGPISLPAPLLAPEDVLTVRQAIGHLEPVPSGGSDPDDPWHRAPDHSERILKRISKTPANGGDRRALSIEEQLDCHIAVDNGKTPGFTDVYGRLRWDTPSVTITAKSSTPSCGRFLHPEQDRNITVREAANLQGFPQSYVFEGSLSHQYRQIGEAVPPIFARSVAHKVLDFISQQEQPPQDLLTFSNFGQVRTRAKTEVKIVDCFAGAGGLSLGFEAAGFEAGFAFDTDSDAVDTYSHNLSAGATRLSILDAGIVDRIELAVGQSPYVLIGGPPCQGFSQQRRGTAGDPRNTLVREYGDLVSRLRRKPIAVVLENVTYLDSPRGSLILEDYIARLSRLNYTVVRHDLNCAEFGVPQLRNRIILVAMSKDMTGHYRGPVPFTEGRWPTVGETLMGIANPASTSLINLFMTNHEPSREGELNKRHIAFVDMGKGRTSIPSRLQLACHTKYDGHLDVYGRLDWFSQARTITGGFDSFTRGEYAHPFFHRSITPREAARIQGFPDWFTFRGNRASVRRQIGNAVPPPVAFAVAKALLGAIREQD